MSAAVMYLSTLIAFFNRGRHIDRLLPRSPGGCDQSVYARRQPRGTRGSAGRRVWSAPEGCRPSMQANLLDDRKWNG